MSDATAPMLGLLLRAKTRAVANRCRQTLAESPLRVLTGASLTGVVWFGLYWLFWLVFDQLDRTPLEATVAIPLVFNFFFVAMLALLTFSNAIIAYGGLFSGDESTWLQSSPLTPVDVVTLKYIEALLFASWSLVLLGLPLMFAMADLNGEPLLYYVLFIAFFLAFIPIPGALGLMVAFVAARYVPRSAVRTLAVIVGAVLTLFVLWGMRTFRFGDAPAEAWLRDFLGRMSFIQSTFLPNRWVATGIDHALQEHWSEACLYLGVTVANALFLSWLAVMWVSRNLSTAHDRATSGRSGSVRPASAASGGISGLVFWYLPLPLRLIAAKDLRTFFRDPLQWSQLVILFGLLVLYLTNMPTLRLSFEGTQWFLVIPFLNLCAVSLILATFTCRFVFPLVSIEGQKLWLVGLLPTPRGRILLSKFAFAMTVTMLVALGAMALAVTILQLDPVWATIHLLIISSVCYGLCGFSVGIGARLPMFGQRNVARIANGLGGTTNLLASVALVSMALIAVGWATWHSRNLPDHALPEMPALGVCLGAILINLLGGTLAMIIGARHFERVEL